MTMININIDLVTNSEHFYCWKKQSQSYFIGQIYSRNDVVFVGTEFIKKNPTSLEVISKVKQCNGYFGGIIETEKSIFLISDRTQTFPLYYSRTKDSLTITNSITIDHYNESDIDETASLAYISCGYCLNDTTLLKAFRQVEAGSVVEIKKNSGQIFVHKYFSYMPKKDQQPLNENEHLERLHQVHLSVFKRMCDSLNNKVVILPLSGGYDSRLILQMLRHFDVENVICVTWGRTTYWQTKIAKKIARHYNYKWFNISNDSKSWQTWLNDKNASLTADFSIGSIPYLQDQLVLGFCQKKLNIDLSQAVIITGNTGDFVEGEHILSTECDQSEQVVTALFKKHFRLNKIKDPKPIMTKILNDSDDYLERHGSLDGFDEWWEWKERQSKFVSKCVTPFNHSGADWRMPFWDLEIMNFWLSVPRELKRERCLFYKYSEIYMDNQVVEANPFRLKFLHYLDTFRDGRYVLFNASETRIQQNLAEMYFSRPIKLSRINGLLAKRALNTVSGNIKIEK